MAKDNVSGKGNTYTVRGDEEFDNLLQRAQKIHKKEKSDLFRSAIETASLVQVVQSPPVLDVTEWLLSSNRVTIAVPNLTTWLHVHGHYNALVERIDGNVPTYFVLPEAYEDSPTSRRGVDHIRALYKLYDEGTMNSGAPEEENFALFLTAMPSHDFILQCDDRILYCPQTLFPEIGFLFWSSNPGKSQEENRFCVAIEKYLDEAIINSNTLVLEPYEPKEGEERLYVGERIRRGPIE